MRAQIITSSYPADPDDAGEAAGLFVRDFALELVRRGHRVVVCPVARKNGYCEEPGITIAPVPWGGGTEPLAALSPYSPVGLIRAAGLLRTGGRAVVEAAAEHSIDRIMCMWAVPSGLLGRRVGRELGIPFDVWALGSDVWKVGGIPLIGTALLRASVRQAARVFADGLGLRDRVRHMTGRECSFLPSCRKMPKPSLHSTIPGRERIELLFVGRYHPNKGPDILLRAVGMLPEQAREGIILRMFGHGPMREQLEELAEQLEITGCVRIRGPITAQDFADHLSRAAYLIIPSRIESIPVVLSDAIQLGTPVISTPVGDLEFLVPERNLGLVSESTDPEDLSRTLAKGLEMAAGDGDHFSFDQRLFTIENTVDQWLDGLVEVQ